MDITTDALDRKALRLDGVARGFLRLHPSLGISELYLSNMMTLCDNGVGPEGSSFMHCAILSHS